MAAFATTFVLLTCLFSGGGPGTSNRECACGGFDHLSPSAQILETDLNGSPAHLPINPRAFLEAQRELGLDEEDSDKFDLPSVSTLGESDFGGFLLGSHDAPTAPNVTRCGRITAPIVLRC